MAVLVAIAQVSGSRWLVNTLGLEGISAAALVLLGMAMYLHRAAAVASTATTAASTGALTAKLTAAILGLLVAVGVFEWDRRQTVSISERLQTAVTEAWPVLEEIIRGIA